MTNFLTQMPTVGFIPIGWTLFVLLEASAVYFFLRKKFRWWLQLLLIPTGMLAIAVWILFHTPLEYGQGGFMRTIKEDGIFKLQVARQKYVNVKTGDTVVMQGICHIGEKALYEEMICYFTDFDYILYEGVVPSEKKKKDEPGEKRDGEKIQGEDAGDKKEEDKKKDEQEKEHHCGDEYAGLAERLGLISQKQGMGGMSSDSNWVWCDVIYGDIAEEAERKGIENPFKSQKEFLEKLDAAINKEEAKKEGFWDELKSYSNLSEQALAISVYVRSGFDIKRLRRMKSDQMRGKMDDGVKYLIVDFRNRKAIHKMKLFLMNPEYQHIALFYGAAHLDGMEKMLIKEGFNADGERKWVTVYRY
jgi:hypothetical protein